MKKNTLKKILGLTGILVLIGGMIVLYLFNVPHRDIEKTSTDYILQATEIVEEYLMDVNKANDKYLDEQGESKILEITGTVSKITIDYNNQKVVLLKNEGDKAGVSCTFSTDFTDSLKKLKIGKVIAVKGVIRSGASYDEDLEMYENVILEKCSLAK